ncbi:MAG: type II toxin-antitoxin system MqsA family antitoxin [Chloroflexi bacterium]|nr:type II toxin-antitoxin system MqsA family antitoxin [Chloroflexota bacterium]
MNKCYFCKGKLARKRIRHVHRWGTRIIIFDDVPAEVCQQCGEVYFSPEVLKLMDEMTLQDYQPKAVIPVPVFSLPERVPA